LHCIHSPTPFPYHLPSPTGATSPLGRTGSTPLFSDFAEGKREKEKKQHFCKFEIRIATQGVLTVSTFIW
jgi:hypothetical protein